MRGAWFGGCSEDCGRFNATEWRLISVLVYKSVELEGAWRKQGRAIRTILSVNLQPAVDVSEGVVAQQIQRLRDVWRDVVGGWLRAVHLLPVLREDVSEAQYQYSSVALLLCCGTWVVRLAGRGRSRGYP